MGEAVLPEVLIRCIFWTMPFEALAVEALKQLKSENDKLREAYEQLLQRIDALEKKRKRKS